MRCILGVLLCTALLFSLVQKQEALDCSSTQLQAFTQRLNASRDALLRQGINSLKAIYGAANPGAPSLTVASTFPAFYQALLGVYGLNPAGESFYTFMKALSYMTNSYYLACYGPAGMRVSADTQSVSALIAETTTLLSSNQLSNVPRVRENFGKIMCIAENFTSPVITTQLTLFFTSIMPNTLMPFLGLGPNVTKVNQIAVIDYTKELENGDLIPTNELPFACKFSTKHRASQ